MIYILMCGGEYEFPRHFTPILGEALIARTVRQLRERGIEPYISATDDRFSEYAPLLKHRNEFKVSNGIVSGAWVDAFYPTDDPVCYLFGDVVFSDWAIRTIIDTQTDSIDFFASVPPFSPNYVKAWAEPFAFKVKNQQRFRDAINYTRANIYTGVFARHPIAWELWQVINGNNPRFINYETVRAINDFTCDIDAPEDAERIEAMICKS